MSTMCFIWHLALTDTYDLQWCNGLLIRQEVTSNRRVYLERGVTVIVCPRFDRKRVRFLREPIAFGVKSSGVPSAT